MDEIEILIPFDGYPDGERLRSFTVGQRPADLTEEYRILLVEKGLAAFVSAELAAASPVEAAETDLAEA